MTGDPHARVDQLRAQVRNDLDELLAVMRTSLSEGLSENDTLAEFLVEFGMPTLQERPRTVLELLSVLMLRVATDDPTLRRK